MRVRMLRQVASTMGTFMPGDVRDISDNIAQGWCDAGLAMQDKSLDGAEETKAESDLYWCKECGCSHRLDSSIGIKHSKEKSMP